VPRWFIPIPSLRVQSIGFFLFHFSLIWTVECGTTHTMQQIQQRAHRCVVARALLIPPFPPSHCTMQPRTSPHQSNHLYCPCSPRPNTCPSHPPPLSSEPSLSPSRNIDSRFDSPVVFTIKRPIIPPSERMV